MGHPVLSNVSTCFYLYGGGGGGGGGGAHLMGNPFPFGIKSNSVES